MPRRRQVLLAAAPAAFGGGGAGRAGRAPPVALPRALPRARKRQRRPRSCPGRRAAPTCRPARRTPVVTPAVTPAKAHQRAGPASARLEPWLTLRRVRLQSEPTNRTCRPARRPGVAQKGPEAASQALDIESSSSAASQPSAWLHVLRLLPVRLAPVPPLLLRALAPPPASSHAPLRAPQRLPHWIQGRPCLGHPAGAAG